MHSSVDGLGSQKHTEQEQRAIFCSLANLAVECDVLETIGDTPIGTCILACTTDVDCWALNYFPQGDTWQCELCNGTRLPAPKPMENHHHYTMGKCELVRQLTKH